MSPEQQLLIENIVTQLSLELALVQKDRAARERVDARLERIEGALALPMAYSLREACRRLGYSERWGRSHAKDLPAPLSNHPLRYRISDVEALAEHGLPRMGRQRRRAS